MLSGRSLSCYRRPLARSDSSGDHRSNVVNPDFVSEAIHDFARVNLANAVTAARAAAALLLLAGRGGWLARRLGAASAFGARFDMEVDAAMVLALSLLVLAAGQAGTFVLASGAMRYLFVAAGLFLLALSFAIDCVGCYRARAVPL